MRAGKLRDLISCKLIPANCKHRQVGTGQRYNQQFGYICKNPRGDGKSNVGGNMLMSSRRQDIYWGMNVELFIDSFLSLLWDITHRGPRQQNWHRLRAPTAFLPVAYTCYNNHTSTVVLYHDDLCGNRVSIQKQMVDKVFAEPYNHNGKRFHCRYSTDTHHHSLYSLVANYAQEITREDTLVRIRATKILKIQYYQSQALLTPESSLGGTRPLYLCPHSHNHLEQVADIPSAQTQISEYPTLLVNQEIY